MASRTISILCSALLTLSLLIDIHCIVEARDSMAFSRFTGNEYSTKGGERAVKDYQGNYGTNGVHYANIGFGSESGNRVGYGSGSGTANEESDKAYFAGSYGAYGSQEFGKEGTAASHKEDSTNTVASYDNAKEQQNGGAGVGNGYGSHSTPYRSAGSRYKVGTGYGSTSRFERDDEFGSGYGVRSGSNTGYHSSYNADSSYGRNFNSNGYNPGSRRYDRHVYGSNSATGVGYEQRKSGYGKFAGGGN